VSDIDQLRMGVATAIAINTENLTAQNYDRFRRKTALWIDESFFKILYGCGVTGLLECGAHEASGSVNFMQAGGKKAVAIEANPITYNAKTKLAEHYGVVSLNCGVGKEAGEIDFFIPQNDQVAGDASFLKKPNVIYESKTIFVDTIDNIYHEQFESNETVALWVDVEGLALDVLKGGGSLLRSDNCLVLKVEVENISFWENQSLVRDVDNYLANFGYKATLRDIEWNGQYNLIYVKENLIDHIDDILIDCWRELAWLKLSLPERIEGWKEQYQPGISSSHKINNLPIIFVYIKHWLTRSDTSRFSIFIHNVAALLGSKSSKQFLKIYRSFK